MKNSFPPRRSSDFLPSPSMLHFRGGRDAVSQQAYPDMDGFFADLTSVYQAEIRALADAGCRSVQMDDTTLAYLCDPQHRERTRARGEDVGHGTGGERGGKSV